MSTANPSVGRTAPRSPWQNACVERVIGSIRHECVDHVIVISAAGLYRVPPSTFRTTCGRERPHRRLSVGAAAIQRHPTVLCATRQCCGDVVAILERSREHWSRYRKDFHIRRLGVDPEIVLVCGAIRGTVSDRSAEAAPTRRCRATRADSAAMRHFPRPRTTQFPFAWICPQIGGTPPVRELSSERLQF
jgi:hypothetical protein